MTAVVIAKTHMTMLLNANRRCVSTWMRIHAADYSRNRWFARVTGWRMSDISACMREVLSANVERFENAPEHTEENNRLIEDSRSDGRQ